MDMVGEIEVKLYQEQTQQGRVAIGRTRQVRFCICPSEQRVGLGLEQEKIARNSVGNI